MGDGTGLTIRPMTEADCTAALVGWLNDRALMAHSRQRHIVHTRESQVAYLHRYDAEPERYLAVIEGDELVGTATLLDHPSGGVEIGTLIGRPGQGIGTRVFPLLIACAQAVADGLPVFVETERENIGMQRVCERNGLRRAEWPPYVRYYVEAVERVEARRDWP